MGKRKWLAIKEMASIRKSAFRELCRDLGSLPAYEAEYIKTLSSPFAPGSHTLESL